MGPRRVPSIWIGFLTPTVMIDDDDDDEDEDEDEDALLLLPPPPSSEEAVDEEEEEERYTCVYSGLMSSIWIPRFFTSTSTSNFTFSFKQKNKHFSMCYFCRVLMVFLHAGVPPGNSVGFA